MAIDYTIALPCPPRETLGSDGILERLKARARAHEVIRLFRQSGDQRPPSEMGFEFERRLPDGTDETRIVMVQDMLDQADELIPLEHFCAGCPANISDTPFGCYSQINYPLSSEAERWLLDQLPGPEQPLPWLLLREGMQANGDDGSTARALRGTGIYFEETRVRGRDMTEFVISADQVFEMLFMVGPISPSHSGMLLLLFGAIPRTMEAPQIVGIMNGAFDPESIVERFPFLWRPDEADDQTIHELKQFFFALHTGWRLQTPVLVDA